MDSVKIHFLGDHAEFIPTIAQWHQNQWHLISPDLTTDLRIMLYRSYISSVDIPTCFVALSKNQPVGSASLVESDMETHRHLGPWLASVYVHSDYRNQGVATQLIERCIRCAQQKQIKTLYLFTADKMNFYLRRGWQLIESTFYHQEKVDIMAYSIKSEYSNI